jgi:hypothetical protein
MTGCGLDFAAGAPMFGNYCNFGAAQKILSPAAVHISPSDLPIIYYSKQYECRLLKRFFSQHREL